MLLLDRIFDTKVDTRKMFVSMNTKIVKRDYENARGKSLLYLHASKNSERIRIPLDIYVLAKNWDATNGIVKTVDPDAQDQNLMIGAIHSKISGIMVQYRLQEKQLSLELFKEEFNNSIPRLDFIAFMDYSLKQENTLLAKGTVRRLNSVIAKLRDWKGKIYFTELDDRFIKKFKTHCTSKGNSLVTIESNIAVIKKFITAAEHSGIKLPIKSREIKVGSTRGDRTDLKPAEIQKIFKFYTSEFINPRYRLTAGYFLFSCFTGLRISDVQQLTRAMFEKETFSFTSTKTKKLQYILVTNKIKEILNQEPILFLKKVTDVEINRNLKFIANICGIEKRLSFHIGRHSFATNFLRMGGDVQTLQSLLGHSKINETMIYVHIVNAEACKKIQIMDNLF